ncbi:MAG: antitoxin [Acidimicrobiales bacterium]
MGFMDKIKGVVAKNTAKAGTAIDKAGDLVDGRTGNKHAGQVDKLQDRAKDYVDKLDDPKK